MASMAVEVVSGGEEDGMEDVEEGEGVQRAGRGIGPAGRVEGVL